MSALTFADDTGFRPACAELVEQVWPEFMLFDPAGDWLPVIYDRFPECQVVLLDGDQRVAAIGNTVPVWWSGQAADLPDRGWDAIVKRGATGKRSNSLSALQAMVRPELQGQGWRVHARLGARVAKVAHRSMTITGSVAEWEARTQLTFPGSGEFVVPGALVPVSVDHSRDRVRYVEPNVWMVHRL